VEASITSYAIRNEVFRAHDLAKVLATARAFFLLLPGNREAQPKKENSTANARE
jgi:hypothetical protein